MTERAKQAMRILTARLAEDELGQDLVEYGLLAAVIAVVAITAISTVGQKVGVDLWQNIVNTI